MKSRILFVSHTTEWTGPTNSLLHLVRHLGDRFEADVLAPGEGPLTGVLEKEGIPARSLPGLDRRRILEVRRMIRRGGYDLVYGNNTSGGCRNALIAARLARVPFVCHVRGMAGRREWRKFGFLRLADAVIAVSRACADSVERYAGAARLHVVHNGVELPPAGIEPPAVDPPLPQASSDARLLVSVAHLCHRKGQHHAVDAMARVVERVPSARLLLVGALDREPEYVDRLRRSIAERGLERHVTILGFREDVQALLGASELFVHTALDDPHPRAVIEAMAAGLPVVAFAVDGVAETVEASVTGLLCPPGATDELARAIVDLLNDPERRRDLGERGRILAARRFSARETAREVERILDRVLGESHGDAAIGEPPADRARPAPSATDAGAPR